MEKDDKIWFVLLVGWVIGLACGIWGVSWNMFPVELLKKEMATMWEHFQNESILKDQMIYEQEKEIYRLYEIVEQQYKGF